jgi:hypothetical protein
LNAVIVAHGTPWAFGHTQADDFAAANTLVERFSAGQWHVVASPSPSGLSQNLYSATTDSAGHVWAVGFFEDDTDFSNHALAIEEAGGSFQIVDTPSPGGASGSKLEGVTRVGGQLMAVGFYRDPATFAPRTLAERWDGSSWQVLASASPGSQDDVLDGIAAAHGTLWAVGWFANSSCDRTLTERFSGGAWTVVKSPNVGGCSASTGASNVLNAVAAARHGTLYAVGARDTRTLVERNAGHGWRIVKSAN